DTIPSSPSLSFHVRVYLSHPGLHSFPTRRSSDLADENPIATYSTDGSNSIKVTFTDAITDSPEANGTLEVEAIQLVEDSETDIEEEVEETEVTEEKGSAESSEAKGNDSEPVEEDSNTEESEVKEKEDVKKEEKTTKKEKSNNKERQAEPLNQNGQGSFSFEISEI